MVLREEFAGRAEAADLFHGGGMRGSAGAEQFIRLIAFKGMSLVVRAYPAAADLPVLFRVPDLVSGRINHRD
jgi:hypothetical protein